MKLIMRFLKPHRKLFIVTVLLLILDVVGALFIPTLSAEMLNMGTSGSSFSELLNTGVQMAAVSLLSGACAILGGYTWPCFPRGSAGTYVWRSTKNP